MLSKLLCLSPFVLGGADAFIGVGPCQDQPSCASDISDESVQDFIGTWYVTHADLASSLSSLNSRCSIFNYAQADGGFTEHQMMSVFGSTSSTEESSTMTEASLRSTIVLADPDNFAVRYTCENVLGGLFHYEKAELLSRAEDLADVYQDQAKAFLEKRCSYSPLLTPQSTECFSEAGASWALAQAPTEKKASATLVTSSSVPTAITLIEEILLDGKIQLKWMLPFVSATPVTEYQVEFEGADGVYRGVPNCVGTQSSVLNEHACEIPLVDFYVNPLNLLSSSALKTRIRSKNSAGYSPYFYSSKLTLPPSVPGLPTDVKIYGGTSKVFVEWQPPAQSGLGPVTQYSIQSVNCGSSGYLTATTRSFTLENLAADKLCDIALQAHNSAGAGASKKVEVRANTVRGNISPATGQEESVGGVAKLKLTWPEPGDSKEILSYKVSFLKSGTSSTYISLPEWTITKQNGVLPSILYVPTATLSSNSVLHYPGPSEYVKVYVEAYTDSDYFTSSPLGTVYLNYLPQPPSKWTRIGSFTGTFAVMDITCEHSEDANIQVTHYELYRKLHYSHGSASFTDADLIETKTTPHFRQTNLASGGDGYHFTCRVKNNWGKGPLNRGISVWRSSTTSSSFVPNLKISNLTRTSATATWEFPLENTSGINDLDIEFRKVSPYAYLDKSSPAITTRSYSMSNLSPDTEYSLEIEYWSAWQETFVWFKTLP